MRQAQAAQGAPDRYAMDRHFVIIGNFQNQIIQREIRLGCHPCRDPIPQTAQLAMTAAIALPTRLQTTRLALQAPVLGLMVHARLRRRLPEQL